MGDGEDGQLTVHSVQAGPPGSGQKVLQDMRSQLQTLPVEAQSQVLAEYRDRRANFRSWLKAQLIEGVHFGYPPGTLPTTKMINGVKHFEQKTSRGTTWIPSTQWQAKPSLYKAGADFIIELMACRDSYSPDRDVWEMMGSNKSEVCMRCDLFDNISGKKIADGHGYGSRGSRDDYDGKSGNTAIKMASKRAKVAAVLNAFGLADLFTQDIEDGGTDGPPEVTNPELAPEAPRDVPTRSDDRHSPGPAGSGSVEVTELRNAFARWSKIVKTESVQLGVEPNVSKENFVSYAVQFLDGGDSASALDPSHWSRTAFRAMEKDLRDSEISLGI
jgi:hypothetical protein